MILPADFSIFDPVVKLVNSKMTWCCAVSLPCPSHGQDGCCLRGMMIIIAWGGILWERRTNIIINYKVRGMDINWINCCCGHNCLTQRTSFVLSLHHISTHNTCISSILTLLFTSFFL